MTDGGTMRPNTFGGFCDDSVNFLAFLKLKNEDLLDGPLIWLHLQFGSNCGTCLLGILSRHTRYMLLIQAAYLADKLTQGNQADPLWGMISCFWLEHVCYF
jgi:hypothetical protein